MVNVKPVVPTIEPNRELRRLLKKKDLAAHFGCSCRQIELMVKAGRLPRPFYLGDSSPRWRQNDIDDWLNKLAADAQQNSDECSIALPRIPSHVIDEVRAQLRLGRSIESLARQLGIDQATLRSLLKEPQWRDLPPEPESTNNHADKPTPKASKV